MARLVVQIVDLDDPRVTVTPLRTSDRTPTLSGTVIAPGLERLRVTVNSVTYDANVIDFQWTAQVTQLLPIGVYDVQAVAETTSGTISDNTTDELTIEQTTLSVAWDDGSSVAWDNAQAVSWD